MAATYNPNFNERSWYRSCGKEIFNPIYGKPTGTIPSWLNGVLIRNGPGLFEFGTTTVNHLFDGMALLHRFEIENGVISYQCRFLQSDAYKKNTKANRIVVTDFGTRAMPDPCQTIFSRISSMFHSKTEVSDNATISVYPFGDEIYAFAETGIMYKVDDSNLQTKTKRDFRKQFGIVTHTSHPHVVEDGTVYNLALSFSRKGPLYHIVCFPNKEKTDANHSMFDEAHVLASIPSKWRLHPSYMHTFGVTENYFIIVEQPMVLDAPRKLLRTFVDAPANDFIRWYNNETTKFVVVSRKTGELVKTFYTNGFIYFHTINQYEDMNHIIIDICTYKDGSVLNSLYIDTMKNAHSDPNFAETFNSTPQRFVLPLSTEGRTFCHNENLVQIPNSASKAYIQENGDVWVEPETICDHFCDLPTFNYNQFVGKKYQYFYGLTPCVESTNPSTLVKADIENKICKLWSEKGCYPSEAIFVSKPNPKSEDDGVILSSLIYAEDERRISLLVLDAETFEEIGRVQFETESPVPRSTHGWYIPKE